MKIISLILILFISVLNAYSGDICVPEPIFSKSIEGSVVFGGSKRHRILSNAEVRIRDRYDLQKIIATTKSDSDGHFIIKDINPGKYLISGHYEGLIAASVEINIISEKEDNKGSLILIVLGADLDSACGGSSITIKTKQYIDNLLKDAKKP